MGGKPSVGFPKNSCDGAYINVTARETGRPQQIDCQQSSVRFEDPTPPALIADAQRDLHERRFYLAWLLRTDQAISELRRQLRHAITMLDRDEWKPDVEREAQAQDKVRQTDLDAVELELGIDESEDET